MIINYKDTDLGIPYDKEPVKNILWGVLLFAEDKIIISRWRQQEGRSGLWTLVFFLHITSEIPHILVGRFAQLLPFTGSEAAASVVHMC